MWPRNIELMLGCWLIVSPFIFEHPPEDPRLWLNDMGCGSLVVVNSLLCYVPRFRYAHLATLAAAVWLLMFGYFYGSYPAQPALQNELVLGLLLLMFALIPTEASLPPRSWQNAPSDKVLLYPEPPSVSEKQLQEEKRRREVAERP